MVNFVYSPCPEGIYILARVIILLGENIVN